MVERKIFITTSQQGSKTFTFKGQTYRAGSTIAIPQSQFRDFRKQYGFLISETTTSPGFRERVAEERRKEEQRRVTGEASPGAKAFQERRAKELQKIKEKKIQPKTQKRVGTLTRAEEPKGFLERTEQRISIASQKEFQREKREGFRFGGTVKQFGLGILASGVSQVRGVKQVVTKPVETFKAIPGAIVKIPETAPKLLTTIRERPAFSTGFITGEIAGTKGAGVVVGKGSKVVGRGARVVEAGVKSKLPKSFTKFRAVEEVGGKQVIRDITKKGVLKTEQRLKDIEVIPRTKGFERIPLTEQVKLAGAELQPVSAQRDLFGLTRKEVGVKKPIPSEEALSPALKRQLKRFDEGKLTPTQTIQLEQRLRKVKGAKTSLLERTFFADPYGKLRPSRLFGAEPKQAGLFESLIPGSDVSFRRPKPQALAFPGVTVEKLPRDIERALRTGKQLTPLQESRLLTQQLTPTGKFKPIGFLSKEPEIILAPGETIVKRGKIAETIIEGRKVKIFEAGIKPVSQRTKALQQKQLRGLLTGKERVELTKRLSKESGFSLKDIESSALKSDALLSRGRAGGEILSLFPKPRKSREILSSKDITSSPSIKTRKILAPSRVPKPSRLIPERVEISRGRPTKRTKTPSRTPTTTRTPDITRTIIPTRTPTTPRVPGITRTSTGIRTSFSTRVPKDFFKPKITQETKRRKVKKRKVKQRRELFFTPGFSAKALGLERKITKKQAVRLLKYQKLTGLGLRESVIIGKKKKRKSKRRKKKK